MPTSKPFSLVRGRRIRVTKTDACGDPVLGPTSVVVSEGFISVGLTANQEEGETISVTNAAGNVCILDEPSPKFLNYTVEVAFCGVNPDLIHLMTGQPLVMNAAGTEAVGFGVDTTVDLALQGFALEMWSNVPAGLCDPGSGVSYGYFLLPFLKGGVLGDFTIENAAVNFTLTGASTKDGNTWGVGPYDVTRDETGSPGPLNEAIPSTRHLHMELVTVAPPEAEDGATALGVPATSATAGTPGSYLPANSYAPADITDAAGLTADPTTDWTTGQYVVLRDGSSMNWNGTAWVAGVSA
jgi:hypothetical protein